MSAPSPPSPPAPAAPPKRVRKSDWFKELVRSSGHAKASATAVTMRHRANSNFITSSEGRMSHRRPSQSSTGKNHTVEVGAEYTGPVLQRSVSMVKKSLGMNAKTYDDARVGIATKTGTLDNKRLKTNQDRGIVCWPFNGQATEALLCIFDGHGEDGHRISEFCSRELPPLLEATLSEHEDDPDRALRVAISQLNRMLFEDEELSRPARLSGTTATVLYARGDEVWIAWVGDSMCVVGQRAEGELIVSMQTGTHKCDAPSEMLRIQQRGGKIDMSEDPVRVWSGGYGLAMSRSIGDGQFKMAGVTADPDVVHMQLSPVKRRGDGDVCIVLASDGVWDVMTALEACEISSRFETARSACETILGKAQERWAAEESYRDDATAIVVFLPFLENPKKGKRTNILSGSKLFSHRYGQDVAEPTTISKPDNFVAPMITNSRWQFAPSYAPTDTYGKANGRSLGRGTTHAVLVKKSCCGIRCLPCCR